jgi:hypothetical protein
MKTVTLNQVEARWIVTALRAFIASPDFGNNYEDVARMGELLVKMCAAAAPLQLHAGRDEVKEPLLTCHVCRHQQPRVGSGEQVCAKCQSTEVYI